MSTKRAMGILGLSAAAIVSASSCRNVDVNQVFEQISEARRLAADLEVTLTRAADTANRAVGADTDMRAVSLAAEARASFDAVEKDVAALDALLRTLDYAEESETLRTFRERFGAYRALEENILGLAVEHTNVKARQLSFGPAQEAATALVSAVDGIGAARAADAWHVRALGASVVAAVREIQVLQAPHIAEPNDAPMTELEQRMAAAERAARASLEALRPLVAAASRPALDAAVAALDRFLIVHGEILKLSRRNTNVRSLALSLERQGAVLAPCEESLRTLRGQLAKRRHLSQRWPWAGR